MGVPVVRSARAELVRAVAVAFVALLIGLTARAAWAQAPESSTNQGQAIAFDRVKGNCLACHQIAGGDLAGNIGPALENMKHRFPDRKEIFELIWDESKRNPQTVMPAFGTNHILTEDEINKLIDFLYSL
jgi:sulfur-oxidizing protein SoxX